MLLFEFKSSGIFLVEIIKLICEPANQEGAPELCQRNITIFHVRQINRKENFNHYVALTSFW